MSTALTRAEGGVPPQLPAPVDKKALAAYLDLIEDPVALELQTRLAAAYDAACAALLGPNDVQKEGDREFKKKSAWRKFARYFGISTEVVDIDRQIIRDRFVCTVTVKATAPWGQTTYALGACGQDEEKGRRTITVADAIATAQTRAINRGISDLVAMGEVSAEEMQKDGAHAASPVDRAGEIMAERLTLEDARALEFPWDRPPKLVGKTMGELDVEWLERIRDWAKPKVDAGTASAKLRLYFRATILILEELIGDGPIDEDEEDVKQEDPKQEDAQATSASTDAPPPSPPSTEPARSIDDEIPLTPEEMESARTRDQQRRNRDVDDFDARLLEDDDDDLPFG